MTVTRACSSGLAPHTTPVDARESIHSTQHTYTRQQVNQSCQSRCSVRIVKVTRSINIEGFGRKKNATAVAHVKAGKGLVKVNGSPLSLVQPEILRNKVYEPFLVAGLDKFAGVDIRVRVSGGGFVSQVYAIRQAISKGIVAFYQKFVDEASKEEIKRALITYDRTLLVADPRRMEPKKYGGPGARARYAKSYR